MKKKTYIIKLTNIESNCYEKPNYKRYSINMLASSGP